MKMLLLGRNGQLGWELQRSLAPLGAVIALGSNAARNPDRLCGDLLDLQGLASTIAHVRPDAIVNAAAYTAVDKAESEPDVARLINTEAPALIAQEATKIGAWVIHYSTDYVFDGSGNQPWSEDDPTAPLSVYGRTKLAGEQAVAGTPKHLVLRTSWVYAARGANFAKTMLRLAGERDALTVISDQFGAPTSAELLADVTAHALRLLPQRPDLAGIYHCVAGGETSWHGYAQYVLEQALALEISLKAGPANVAPTSTANYPTPAQRPLNSRLDTRKLQTAFDLTLPNWQAGVTRMLTEISGK